MPGGDPHRWTPVYAQSPEQRTLNPRVQAADYVAASGVGHLGQLRAVVDSWQGPPRDGRPVGDPQGSAQTQHAIRERREPTGNNGHSAEPSGPLTGPKTGSHDRSAIQEMAADQRKRQPTGYFSSCLAMTTRWI